MISSNENFQVHNNQEYTRIRDECLKDKKRLWEDTSYIATFDKRSDWEWKRPGEIMSNPCFINVGNEPLRFNLQNINLRRSPGCEIVQNLAALSTLTLHSKVFRFVVPEDNSEFSSKNYVGLFHFRIWRYGKFYDVVVDDRLPTCGGTLVSFLKNEHPKEFWPFLLEKAYTKLCGWAESLSTTTAHDFVVDITGGVSEVYNSLGHVRPVSRPELDQILYDSLERNSFIIFGRHWHTNVENMNTGKVYCITKAVNLEIDESEQIMLLLIFNPFETEMGERKEPWSEESEKWKSIPETKKKELGELKKYESWILFTEFNKHDWEIQIFHLNPRCVEDKKGEEPKGLKWFQNVAEGKWVKGVSSGGNRRDHLATFHLNPQVQISLKVPDAGFSDCTMIISLLQKTHKSDRFAMGAYVFKLKHKVNERLGNEFFIHNNPITDPFPLPESREISSRLRISQGEYCIVIATNIPHNEASFILRVLTEQSINMSVLDEKVRHKDIDVRLSLAPSVSIRESLQTQEFDKNISSFFEDVSGEDGVVGWKGLKKVLDFAMDSDVPKSKKYTVRNSFFTRMFPSNSVFDTMDKKEFSKDLTRSLLATADIDYSGKLTLSEFQSLWSQIRQWIQVYELHSNENGYLHKEHLRDALDSAGFQLNNDILSNLAVRYSNVDDRILFDDFLMCTSKLRTVFNYFRVKDPENSDKAAFSLEEWLQKSIYS